MAVYTQKFPTISTTNITVRFDNIVPANRYPMYSKINNAFVDLTGKCSAIWNGTMSIIILDELETEIFRPKGFKIQREWTKGGYQNLQEYFVANGTKRNVQICFWGSLQHWEGWGTLTIDYTLPIFNIQVTASKGGTVSGGGTFDVNFDPITKSISAIPDKGYEFDYWVDEAGKKYYTQNLDITFSDKTITAFQTNKKYTAHFKNLSKQNIYIGKFPAKEIYVGNKKVKSVYIGTTKIL